MYTDLAEITDDLTQREEAYGAVTQSLARYCFDAIFSYHEQMWTVLGDLNYLCFELKFPEFERFTDHVNLFFGAY